MKDADTISVVIADPQFLTRKSMRELINQEQGFEVIGELEHYNTIAKKMSSWNPDILVIAITQQNFKLMVKCLKSISKVKFLIMFDEFDFINIPEFEHYEGMGMLTKQCTLEEIRSALQKLAVNESYVCQYIKEQIEEHQLGFASRSRISLLSGREREILMLIGKGMTTKIIAEKLFISVHTVNNHRKNIIQKLKVESPVQLITYALDSEHTSTNH